MRLRRKAPRLAGSAVLGKWGTLGAEEEARFPWEALTDWPRWGAAETMGGSSFGQTIKFEADFPSGYRLDTAINSHTSAVEGQSRDSTSQIQT
jgi:hypothetical protein